jgi:hypothetical protein
MQLDEQTWLQHLQVSIEALDGGADPSFGRVSAHVAAQRWKRHRREESHEGATLRLTSHGAVIGLVWAIDDHPLFAVASATAVCNSVRTSGQYRMAPWAVLDAVVKGTKVEVARQNILREIPQLLYSTLPPILTRASSERNAKSPDPDAIALALQVTDLLRSWHVHDDARLRAAVATAGDRLRYELHIAIAGGESLVARSGGSSATPTSEQLAVKSELSSSLASVGQGGSRAAVDIIKKEAIAKVLQAIAPAVTASATQRGQDATNSAAKGGARRAMTGLDLVREVAKATRIHADQYACDMCGAYFDTPEAKDAHSRIHFFWRRDANQQMARLPSLTEEDVVRYDCNHSDGSYAPAIWLPDTSASAKSSSRLTRRMVNL